MYQIRLVLILTGEHIYLLDAQNLAAGIYYVHLTTSNAQVTQKVIVTKRDEMLDVAFSENWHQKT